MEINLLYMGVIVFGVMLLGIGFTVVEFRTNVNPPQGSKQPN